MNSFDWAYWLAWIAAPSGILLAVRAIFLMRNRVIPRGLFSAALFTLLTSLFLPDCMCVDPLDKLTVRAITLVAYAVFVFLIFGVAHWILNAIAAAKLKSR
jgi:hypothetical protein